MLDVLLCNNTSEGPDIMLPALLSSVPTLCQHFCLLNSAFFRLFVFLVIQLMLLYVGNPKFLLIGYGKYIIYLDSCKNLSTTQKQNFREGKHLTDPTKTLGGSAYAVVCVVHHDASKHYHLYTHTFSQFILNKHIAQ